MLSPKRAKPTVAFGRMEGQAHSGTGVSPRTLKQRLLPREGVASAALLLEGAT
jgi:hypothetical protein